MSKAGLEPIVCLVGVLGSVLPLCVTSAASPSAASHTTSKILERSTQALVDAFAPGERSIWEHYTDPAFTYVTENNEVKSRAQMLDDFKALPPGSDGWIDVQEFRCIDFGSFAVKTYIIDEHESVQGHALHARYRESDTWRETRAGWRVVAPQVYAIPQDPPRGELSPDRLEEYEGLYTLGSATNAQIRRVSDHLVLGRVGRAPQILLPESGDVFFTPGQPRTRLIFSRSKDGSVNGFADRRDGIDLVWSRISLEIS